MVKTGDTGRRKRVSSIADSLPADVKRLFKAQGFAQEALITRWADVVGPHWAEDSLPIKLVFAPGSARDGTLTVAIDGPLAPEFQHLEPLILERIASVFGYRAVARIRLVHQDLSALRRAKGPKRIAPAPLPAEDAALINAITRPGLREALQGLGQTLAGRDAQSTSQTSAKTS
jgi:hypothetical protein